MTGITNATDMRAFSEPRIYTHSIDDNGGEWKGKVYTSAKKGRPLLVLHELPGMTPQFLGFCNLLIDNGYQVNAPLMFGDPAKRMKATWMAGVTTFCLNREFTALFSCIGRNRKTAGMSRWMLEHLDVMARVYPDQKIGVIGMCLTGGFALAGIAHNQVHAGVLAQPSMPFVGSETTRIMDAATLRRAKERAKSLGSCLRGYRYQKDIISRKGHIADVEKHFGQSFKGKTLDGRGHATLTEDFSPEVADDVLAFLAERL